MGIPVLQLETTAGSLIGKVSNSLILGVERRRRYVPVKTTADLMLIQSNIFTVKHGQLMVSSDRIDQPLPLIKLGKAFAAIDD